jgi:hypothetical protein
MAAEISELESTLRDLDLQQYFSDLVEHGFDTWDNLSSIKETDMAVLGIKLGHRRKLQREIARRQGYLDNSTLSYAESTRLQTNEQSVADGNTQEPHGKRRYRRKPPTDPNAPSRPDTAYVAYTKTQRQDPEVANLSFIEIAKLIGARWANLPDDSKDIWNQQAKTDREKYNSAIAEYHKTTVFQQFQAKVHLKLPRKGKREDRVSSNDSSSQFYSPEPANSRRSSTAEDAVFESPLDSLKRPQQGMLELGQHSATASVC